jgi:hypothetical protein
MNGIREINCQMHMLLSVCHSCFIKKGMITDAVDFPFREDIIIESFWKPEKETLSIKDLSFVDQL